MAATLLSYEPALRLTAFAAVFFSMAAWEVLAPCRSQSVNRVWRWPNNLGVTILNTVMVRAVLPTGAVAMALLAEANGWGLLNWLAIPVWATIPLAVITLDLAIYLQHVMFHWVPALWRFHRMHHADLEFDVTTGARFHPIEILLSMVIKLGLVVALGIPATAVLIFEILLNATAMFNHANIRLPHRVDQTLRWFLVTPDMHRVHHSIETRETNSNYGFNLTWWDRLFGTYRDQPEAGHTLMTIGIEQFRNPCEQRLDRMLTQPFREDQQQHSTHKQTNQDQPPASD